MKSCNCELHLALHWAWHLYALSLGRGHCLSFGSLFAIDPTAHTRMLVGSSLRSLVVAGFWVSGWVVESLGGGIFVVVHYTGGLWDGNKWGMATDHDKCHGPCFYDAPNGPPTPGSPPSIVPQSLLFRLRKYKPAPHPLQGYGRLIEPTSPHEREEASWLACLVWLSARMGWQGWWWWWRNERGANQNQMWWDWCEIQTLLSLQDNVWYSFPLVW